MAKGVFFKAEIELRKRWRDLPLFWKRVFGFLASVWLGIGVNNVSQGGWLMIFASLLIMVLGAFLVHCGHAEAVRRKVVKLFWYWVCCSAIFLLTLLICKFLVWQRQESQISGQKNQLTWFTNALSETNAFYIGETNALDRLVEELRNLAAGKQTSYSPAILMGFHDTTNYITATNLFWATNVIDATNTLTFYAGSAVLDYLQLKAIEASLGPADTNFTISIFAFKSPPDSIPLSKQLCQVFLAAGFRMKILAAPEISPPPLGIVVASSRNPTAAFYNGVSLFGRFIGESVLTDNEKFIPPNEVWIFIPTRKKQE